MPPKRFLISKFKQKKFRVDGLIDSPRLPNKPQLRQRFDGHVLYRPEQLPPKVDLRRDMTPVEYQEEIGSCVANCVAAAFEYLLKKANGRHMNVSRLFIYYNARVKEQGSNKVSDIGCTMSSAIDAIAEFGACLESTWPYDVSRVDIPPNNHAYREAEYHKITGAYQLNIDLYEMKSCLAQGYPFLFGIKLYSTFDQAAKTGVVPMPNQWDIVRRSHRRHAMLAVGYSDRSQAFIVRNSWGEDWGDRGYCYIPYEYMTDPRLCSEVWTVTHLATHDLGKAHWDMHDMMNYTHHHKNDGFHHHHHVDNHGQIIDINDDDSHDHNVYNKHDPWSQYEIYAGHHLRYPHHHSPHPHRHHHRRHHQQQHHDAFNRYPRHGNFYYDQFREGDKFFDFGGGYPNFFKKQTRPHRTPAPFHRYGFNYGYASPLL